MNKDEIYQTAIHLIDRYGAEAVGQAAYRAESMIATGNMEGATMWKRILEAVCDLYLSDGQTKH